MAHGLQPLHCFGGNAGFDEQGAERVGKGTVQRLCRLWATIVVEARGIACFLQVHAVIDDVDQYLHMALRLHAAAHQAKGHVGLAILLHERRDDRLEGALSGLIGIGMRRIEAE